MTNKKILIVEDDADVRLGYQILLKANHYDTFFAADSSSAVSEARKHKPDLIILDLGLPAGDGFIVLERFRGNTNLAVIPVSWCLAATCMATRNARSRRVPRLLCKSRGMTMSCWR